MPTLDLSNFNIVCAVLGGFITLFGPVSYLLKEKFYLSEALIATLFGVIFSPHALNWVKPLEYANNNPESLETITLYFSRLVLGVQLVLAGVQLPSKYLWKEWKSLSILLGPGMCIMWLSTSFLVWALAPGITILMHSLLELVSHRLILCFLTAKVEMVELQLDCGSARLGDMRFFYQSSTAQWLVGWPRNCFTGLKNDDMSIENRFLCLQSTLAYALGIASSDNSVIPIYRLIPLGILVLLFRRLPMILGVHFFIHQIEEIRHAIFVGFFGPIGVSAIFYLYIAREFLAKITVDGVQEKMLNNLAELIEVVVLVLVACSILVHGLSIPLGKLGLYLPRTISTAVSSERQSRTQSQARGDDEEDPDEPRSFHIRQHLSSDARILQRSFRHRRPTTSERGPATDDNKIELFPSCDKSLLESHWSRSASSTRSLADAIASSTTLISVQFHFTSSPPEQLHTSFLEGFFALALRSLSVVLPQMQQHLLYRTSSPLRCDISSGDSTPRHHRVIRTLNTDDSANASEIEDKRQRSLILMHGPKNLRFL
ncbi:hypothetical protein MRB53_041669 [Persea americana]|nr:hypothetical protein MRB53_041669 [Persea americana]